MDGGDEGAGTWPSDGGGERAAPGNVGSPWVPAAPPSSPPLGWPEPAELGPGPGSLPPGIPPGPPAAQRGGGWVSPPPPPSGPPSGWTLAPGAGAPPGPPATDGSGRWLVALALVAVGLLLVVGLVALQGGEAEDTAVVVGDPAPASAEGSSTTGAPAPAPTVPVPVPAPAPTTTEPPPTTTAPPVRLLPEVPIPAQVGPHVWLATEPDGEPVRWDPCDPIRFVVNSRLAPPGAPEIVAEAMARVTAATGLVFQDAGPSDEVPPSGTTRPLRDPARYGDRWSPVLISWTDATEVPELVEFAGLARAYSVWAARDEAIFVSGHIELDAADAAQMLSWGDREHLVALVMHELGHLVGLGHVREATEVMTDDPAGVNALDWGPGDRFGLATLGRGECDAAI